MLFLTCIVQGQTEIKCWCRNFSDHPCLLICPIWMINPPSPPPPPHTHTMTHLPALIMPKIQVAHQALSNAHIIMANSHPAKATLTHLQWPRYLRLGSAKNACYNLQVIKLSDAWLGINSIQLLVVRKINKSVNPLHAWKWIYFLTVGPPI